MKQLLAGIFALMLQFSKTFAQNNVGIGTASPHSSARLDITATDKGILVPRISLSIVNNPSPVAGPAAGLLVWNINAAFPNGIGYNYWDGAKWQLLITDQSGWRLNGNTGTNPATHFIGTMDNQPLVFKSNNLQSGKIDPILRNVFLGSNAGINTSPTNLFNAIQNVFIGDSSGMNHTNGTGNTFVGFQSGASTTGLSFSNSFFGTSSGESNISGSFNSFFGGQSGSSNTTASGNSFIGYNSGSQTEDGINNSFFGRNSGSSNQSGNRNTYVGFNSGGSNGSGNNNAALGDSSGYTMLNGANDNTFLGHRTGNQGISFNATAVGARARINCSNCMILGSVDGINGATSSVDVGIGVISPKATLHISGSPVNTGLEPHSDAVLVVERTGDEAYISLLTDPDQASAIIFGSSNNTSDGGIFYNTLGDSYDLRLRTNGNATHMTIDSVGRVGIGLTDPAFQLELEQNSAAKPTSNVWTVPSDLRLKENIHSFQDGLSILKEINPVWFTYNGDGGLPKETGVGTIAQELKAIVPYMIKEWTKKDPQGVQQRYLAADYGPLQFILINSIKEQQKIIEQQQKQIDDHKTALEELKKRIETLEKGKN